MALCHTDHVNMASFCEETLFQFILHTGKKDYGRVCGYLDVISFLGPFEDMMRAPLLDQDLNFSRKKLKRCGTRDFLF